jgi:hypothetical protein
MNEKLRNLVERRKSLIAEAAAQRLLMAQNIEAWRSPLDLADRGLAAVSYIKSHPVWTAAASLGLLSAMRSSRTGKWLQRGWIAWQVLRKLSNKS